MAQGLRGSRAFDGVGVHNEWHRECYLLLFYCLLFRLWAADVLLIEGVRFRVKGFACRAI